MPEVIKDSDLSWLDREWQCPECAAVIKFNADDAHTKTVRPIRQVFHGDGGVITTIVQGVKVRECPACEWRSNQDWYKPEAKVGDRRWLYGGRLPRGGALPPMPPPSPSNVVIRTPSPLGVPDDVSGQGIFPGWAWGLFLLCLVAGIYLIGVAMKWWRIG